jgi:hypothetical protein
MEKTTARYAIKILKIPNNLHTYVHNHLKQHISRKLDTNRWGGHIFLGPGA